MNECYYEIDHADREPEMKGLWDGPAWSAVAELSIEHFQSRSSDHRPRTRVKLLYTTQRLHVLFNVDDRFVRSVHQGYQQPVCLDSCVEFFVEPLPNRGYFNFEINCGGALLVYHIIDHSVKPHGGFKDYRILPDHLLRQVSIYHSMPSRVEPEITDPVNWQVELAIPWQFFEAVLGPITPSREMDWSANFYKCGGATSHPHWASWSPLRGSLSFHEPSCFGRIHFSPVSVIAVHDAIAGAITESRGWLASE